MYSIYHRLSNVQTKKWATTIKFIHLQPVEYQPNRAQSQVLVQDCTGILGCPQLASLTVNGESLPTRNEIKIDNHVFLAIVLFPSAVD